MAARFGLGQPAREPVRVRGGLSNDLWRLDTDRGAFAVKRMIVNADRPTFVDDVEAAFTVERRAWAAGVPMPEPVVDPVGGHALARLDDALFRVHRWVDGTPGVGSAVEAAGLLARIHAAGEARWDRAPSPPWTAERWGAELVGLAFAEGVAAYARCSGVVVPARPWVFAGWVSGQGGWLDHTATALRGEEARAALGSLRRLAARMDALLAALS